MTNTAKPNDHGIPAFPLAVRLQGRRCVIVGGGRVATRKANTLRSAGASVTVIAPDLTQELKALGSSGHIHVVERPYQHGDCAEAWLVVAATDNDLVNYQVAAESEAIGTLTNRADKSSAGDVLFGAVFQAGSVSVMVSTDGGNPNAARWVRDEIERTLGPLIGILGETMHTDDDQMTRRSYAQIDQQMKLEQAKGPTA